MSGLGVSRRPPDGAGGRRRAATALAIAGLVAAACAGGARADETYATGLKFSNLGDVEKLPPAQLKRGFVAVDRVDLSPSMPPPGDQGRDGTCAAWASVYGAGSYYARFTLKQPQLALSPSYVFNQVDHNVDQCAESSLIENVKFLMAKGAPSLESYPQARFCEPPAQAAQAATPIFRASDAELLALVAFGDDGSREVKKPFDVDTVRQKLAEGAPVIVGMRTTGKLLQNLRAGQVYDYQTAKDPTQPHGGHAFVLVGYDNDKQAFRFMNSWGRDWADGGYGWLSYASARSELAEALVLVGETPPPPPPPPRPNENSRPAKITPSICGDVAVEPTPRGFALLGFVGSVAERDQIEAHVADYLLALGLPGRTPVVDELAIRPWPQCEALLTLEAPLAAADRPRLNTLDGRTRLRIGDNFGFELRAPDYPSFLYLIYLQADGQAVNLLPRRGLVREQTPPGAVFRLGEPGGGGPKFRASEPAGDEAVIAIAARSPIAELEALEQAGGRYFRLGADEASATGEATGDRRVLSAINDSLRARPLPGAPPRRVAADVVFLNVER